MEAFSPGGFLGSEAGCPDVTKRAGSWLDNLFLFDPGTQNLVHF
jgi:hypothetical protein